MSIEQDHKQPTPDPAEHNAFFPSPYSLSQYTSPVTGAKAVSYAGANTDKKRKILMIASDERYLLMKDGKFFSTGNHPVEMLLPMYHMTQAGFDIDVATLSGNPVKLEIWALPEKDELVMNTYQNFLPQLVTPLKLTDILEEITGPHSPYVGVFIPGGHGVMNSIPQSKAVKSVLQWAMHEDKYVISLCHGPAGLLAASIDEAPENYMFKGYQICVFPDSLDTGANIDIGYIPGPMPWLVGERLKALGVEILNSDITGKCHQDRRLITGDSPLASDLLGRMAAEALIRDFAQS
ncbi:glyoxalase III HchA [Acinetobacter sp. WZC-1]|uniref:glyoxalase III HchA n=1 Tax=Acinetobacter sp. WZC-1 TaxID=3459034 RepID=UPI00403D7F2C